MARELSDWLEHYLQFTENSESPTLYHLWSGVTAISSALRRKCFCNWGLRGYIYPNFYICLVGPPGGRKGTAMKIAKSMVQKVKIPTGSDALGSAQALYAEIIEAEDSFLTSKGLPKTHKSLSVWSEEFQVFLSDRDPILIGSLTDLFDCADVWKYRTLKRGVENVSNCWLTIIGAITPSLLQTKLTSDAIGGGLVSRIIFVVGYGAIKKIAIPLLSIAEEKLQKTLINDLQRIAQLSGPFKLKTDFLQTYSAWYESANADVGIDSEKFMGYNARRALHLNKLCMVLCASESDDMILLPRHFNKALAILEHTENEMPNAFQGYGVGEHADKWAKILSWIESKTKFTFVELLTKFQFDAMPHELDDFMSMAEQGGLVTCKIRPNSTNAEYVVHSKKQTKRGTDYLDQTVFSRMEHNILKGEQ